MKCLTIVILVALFVSSHSSNKEPVLELLQLTNDVTLKVEDSWKNIKNGEYSSLPIQIVNRHRQNTFKKKSTVDNLIKNINFASDEQTLESVHFNDLIQWTEELNTICLFYQNATVIQNADASTVQEKLQSIKILRDKIRQLTTGNRNRVRTLAYSLKVISKFTFFCMHSKALVTQNNANPVQFINTYVFNLLY